MKKITLIFGLILAVLFLSLNVSATNETTNTTLKDLIQARGNETITLEEAEEMINQVETINVGDVIFVLERWRTNNFPLHATIDVITKWVNT